MAQGLVAQKQVAARVTSVLPNMVGTSQCFGMETLLQEKVESGMRVEPQPLQGCNPCPTRS